MSIYKRGKGKYVVVVDVAAGPSGKRKRFSPGSFNTRAEAERAERQALSAKDNGIDLSPRTVKVAELVARYVADRESLGRGLKTVEEYRRTARLHIDPHLGTLTVAKLQPAMVSAWVSKLVQSGGKDKKPLAAKTARHAFALLSAALRWGVRLELAGRNVCESVDAPKSARHEARAHSDDDRSKLVRAARGTRWEHFIALAFASGARRGELLALTWDRIDLTAGSGSMTIAASLSQTGGRVFIKSTKSDRVRFVPLSADMVAAFRAQRALQAADRLRLGTSYAADLASPACPVFTDELGLRQTPKSATNAIARLAKSAGVSTTSLHALRHTAATLMIREGVDVRTVASILGHANASITLGIYSHVVEGAERSAINRLQDRLAEPADRKRVL